MNKSYLVSIPEASDLLGVSVYFVKKAVNSGNLEAREFEGRTYIVRKTVEEYIASSGATVPQVMFDSKGIKQEYEHKFWDYNKGPMKTLAGQRGVKQLSAHPGWADHTEVKKDRNGKTYWVSHPYQIGTRDTQELAYLTENGWKVMIGGYSYYEGSGTVKIEITEAEPFNRERDHLVEFGIEPKTA